MWLPCLCKSSLNGAPLLGFLCCYLETWSWWSAFHFFDIQASLSSKKDWQVRCQSPVFCFCPLSKHIKNHPILLNAFGCDCIMLAFAFLQWHNLNLNRNLLIKYECVTLVLQHVWVKQVKVVCRDEKLSVPMKFPLYGNFWWHFCVISCFVTFVVI